MSVPLAEKSRDSGIKSQPTKIGVRAMSNDYSSNNPGHNTNVRESIVKSTNQPPADLINQNHHKIETRTKKPNLAHLNNTTLMSIDDSQNPGHRSPMDNSIIRGRTPNQSSSPNPEYRSSQITNDVLNRLNNAKTTEDGNAAKNSHNYKNNEDI